MSAVEARDPRVQRAAVALLCVVAAGALALSFTGLALLGALAGFAGLAPVFAVVVDAGTGAATLYWLTGSPSSRRTRYARRLGLVLLALSLIGNAGAHGLAAGGVPVEGLAAGLVLTMPWWAAAAVGATPPVIFAGVVHLLAMADDVPVGDAGEGWETDRETAPDWWASAPAVAPSTVAEYVAARALTPAPPAPVGDRATDRVPAGEHGDDAPVGEGDTEPDSTTDDTATPTPGDSEPAAHHASPTAAAHPGDQAGGERAPAGDQPDPRRVAALLADGAGRRRLSRELDITEHAARELIAAHGRNGHRAEATR